MLESLRQLVKIQSVDGEIAIVDAELAKLPAERSGFAAAIQQAKDAIGAATELRDSEEREERRLEADMREQETLMERLNSQSGQVTSTKGYQALQHEIDAASEAGSGFETRALELMEAIDQAKEDVAGAEEAFADLEASAPERLAEIAKRQQHFETERSELLARRSQQTEGVPGDLLTRYERVALKLTPAIVVLPAKVCPRCQMAVAAQLASEIKRAEAVHACVSCRRLLVCPEAATG